jgi:hypothetical protein
VKAIFKYVRPPATGGRAGKYAKKEQTATVRDSIGGADREGQGQ